MTTDAQINANRRNASKSTGPKTQKGKDKARQNALKHGGRAKVIDVMPVLPNEDPKQLQERIQAWIDDWQPRNAMECDLVQYGANLSWLVERGQLVEAAHLAHRVRKAGTRDTARRMKVVSDPGRKLFFDAQLETLRSEPPPPWDDEPAVFVAGLEESSLSRVSGWN